MKEKQTIPPAFPDARSKNLRSRVALFLVAIAGNNGTKQSDGLMPAFFIGFLYTYCAVGMIWCLRFWRTIDEAARRAHLDALYWGGSITWIVISPLIALPFAIDNFQLPYIQGMDMSSSQIFALGIGMSYILMLIGYGIAWLIWWAKKR